MSRVGIWRRRLWVWLVPLVVVLLNIGALLLYRAEYAGQVPALERRLQNARQELADLEAETRVVRRANQIARKNRNQLGRFYEDVLSTQSRRFTEVITEVKSLARRAGLQPSSFSYPTEELEDYGLIKRSIVFTVSGSYLDLRNFINLLELSQYFLTLEEVGLSGREEGVLRINLKVSMLFRQERVDLDAVSGATEAES